MSSRSVLLAGAGAAGLFALAACTPGAAPATPVTPSVPASASAAPSTSAPASPSTSPAASPAGGQGGSGAGLPSWSKVDFAAEARTSTHCLAGVKKDEVFAVKYADLTGDGRTEALVTAACPSATSQNPVAVFVYDGQDRSRPLHLLAAIGADHDLTEIKVSTHGRTVSIDARGRSTHTGLCCPDLRITETWTFSGGKLHRTASQQHPL
jgi:hypothetical protein